MTTNYKEQIERLRDDPRPNEWKNGLGPASMEAWHKTCLEAADSLETLVRRVEELEALVNEQHDDLIAETLRANKAEEENELLEAVAEAAKTMDKTQIAIALGKLNEHKSTANKHECVYCYGTGRVWNDRPKEWEQCVVCLGSGVTDDGQEETDE